MNLLETESPLDFDSRKEMRLREWLEQNSPDFYFVSLSRGVKNFFRKIEGTKIDNQPLTLEQKLSVLIYVLFIYNPPLEITRSLKLSFEEVDESINRVFDNPTLDKLIEELGNPSHPILISHSKKPSMTEDEEMIKRVRDLILQGNKNNEISRIMGISIATVMVIKHDLRSNQEIT